MENKNIKRKDPIIMENGLLLYKCDLCGENTYRHRKVKKGRVLCNKCIIKENQSTPLVKLEFQRIDDMHHDLIKYIQKEGIDNFESYLDEYFKNYKEIRFNDHIKSRKPGNAK